MRYLILHIFLLIALVASGSNILYLEQDSLIFEKYKKSIHGDIGEPIANLIVKTALYFRDTPYVAATLDQNEREQLVINLRELDCTTFVENCIALAKTMQSGNRSFDNYCQNLQKIRYRGGVVDGYSSRLHYVTDWVRDNEKRKNVTDISENIGGVWQPKEINFMSNHIDAYRPLLNNRAEQAKIRDVEQGLNKLGGYTIVEKNDIDRVLDKIKDGDIIIFATVIDGLDYTHIGIAYWVNSVLKFIHASTRPMKVVVESQSLVDYCQKIKKCTGITVLRIN